MKLYLAGPDVFLPDAKTVGKTKRALCERYGFIGLFPLDNEITAVSAVHLSERIFEGNIQMLRDADAVVANLTPFRGVSADVGTVFEIGYGFALGKKIYGYSNIRVGYIERIQKLVGDAIKDGSDGRLYAADNLAIENFDRFDNLMIAEALLASGHDIVLPPVTVRDPLRDLQAFELCLRAISGRDSELGRVATR